MKFLDRIRRHVINPLSPHRKIALGFLWILFFAVVGKLAAVAKEVTVAWRYGTSPTVDAYALVFNLAIWPVAIWVNTLIQTLVPQIVRMKQHGSDELARFQSEFFGFSILAGFLLSVLIWFVLVAVSNTTWVSFDGQAAILVREMIDGIVLMLPFAMIGCFISTWMMAYGRHDSTIFEAIPSVVIFVVLLLPYYWPGQPMLWATVIGYVLYMIALVVVQQARRELFAPTFAFSSPEWRKFWAGIGPVMFIQVSINLSVVIDQLLAAHLEMHALSILGYVNRIVGFVLALSSIAITRATLPVFAECCVEDNGRLRTVAITWTKWILVCGFAAIPICWGFSQVAVQTLFERGAFTMTDTELVASALRFAILPIPIFTAVLVLSNFVVIQGNYKLLVIATILGMFIKIGAALILTDMYGLKGLFISSAIAYAAIIITLLYSNKIFAIENSD